MVFEPHLYRKTSSCCFPNLGRPQAVFVPNLGRPQVVFVPNLGRPQVAFCLTLVCAQFVPKTRKRHLHTSLKWGLGISSCPCQTSTKSTRSPTSPWGMSTTKWLLLWRRRSHQKMRRLGSKALWTCKVPSRLGTSKKWSWLWRPSDWSYAHARSGFFEIMSPPMLFFQWKHESNDIKW